MKRVIFRLLIIGWCPQSLLADDSEGRKIEPIWDMIDQNKREEKIKSGIEDWYRGYVPSFRDLRLPEFSKPW